MRRVCFLFLVWMGLAFGQGRTALSLPAFDCFRMDGPGSLSRTAVDGPGFDTAWDIQSDAQSGALYDIRIRCWDTEPVHKNDLLVASFWMRTISSETGKGFAIFESEKGAPPWTKSVMRTVTAGSEWVQYRIPFREVEDYPTPGVKGIAAWREDTYNIGLWVAFPRQEIQIGGFSLLNYGADANPSDLGLNLVPYEGNEPDAPWRSEADERIERIRKTDVTLTIIGEDGAPAADAAVRFAQTRHAFVFGAAVNALGLLLATEDGRRYRETFLSSFNAAVFENDLKWPQWEAGSWSLVFPALDWLRANAIRTVRGHNIIWPARGDLPSDVAGMLDQPVVDKVALRQRIINRIVNFTSSLQGSLEETDVVNEPVTNRDLQNVLGENEITAWFNLARLGDRTPRLYLNDFGIVESTGYDLAHQRALMDLIPRIAASGPLDGIGIQAHFSVDLTSPARLWEVLEQFAGLGKELKISEFSLATQDDQLQADYLRDFLTLVFSHPAVTAEAALIRTDWSPRPAYDTWMDLVYRKWWTDVSGPTDAEGTWHGRGFLGDYQVEIRRNGRRFLVPTTLSRDGGNIRIELGKLTSSPLE